MDYNEYKEIEKALKIMRSVGARLVSLEDYMKESTDADGAALGSEYSDIKIISILDSILDTLQSIENDVLFLEKKLSDISRL